MPEHLKRLILLAHSQAGLLTVTALIIVCCVWMATKWGWSFELTVFTLFLVGFQYGAVVQRKSRCAAVITAVFGLIALIYFVVLMADLQDLAKGLRPPPMFHEAEIPVLYKFLVFGPCLAIAVIMGLWALRLHETERGNPDPITGEGGTQVSNTSNHLARLKLPLPRIADLCGQHRIKKLTMLVFEDFEYGNPCDLLVEFKHGTSPGLAFFTIEHEFAGVLDRPVNLMTPIMNRARNVGRMVSIERPLYPSGHRPRPIKKLPPLLSPAGYPMTFDFPARPSPWIEKPTEPAPRPDLPRGPVAEFCRTHCIRRLLLIDPAWRRSTVADDIDLLAEFELGHAPGLVFFGLEQELSALVDRRVDLRTPGFLSRRVRDQMLASARVLYEAA